MCVIHKPRLCLNNVGSSNVMSEQQAWFPIMCPSNGMRHQVIFFKSVCIGQRMREQQVCFFNKVRASWVRDAPRRSRQGRYLVLPTLSRHTHTCYLHYSGYRHTCYLHYLHYSGKHTHTHTHTQVVPALLNTSGIRIVEHEWCLGASFLQYVDLTLLYI